MNGDRMTQLRRSQTHQRRFIGRRDDDDGPLQSRFAERQVDELAHFPSALADESDHDDIRDRLPRDQAEQYALADAAAGHEADALPFTEREHAVDRAHADVEGLVYGLFLQWIDSRGLRVQHMLAAESSASVHRLAETVHDPSEPGRPDP